MAFDRFLKLGLIILAGAVSACSMYKEGNISPNRVQVKQERFFEQVPLSKMTNDYIYALGKNYNRYGDGPIDLSVTYDPKSKSMTAMKANNEVARLTELFRKNGMKDVNAGVLSVQGHDEGMAVISYTSYSAHAPKDCGVLEGVESTDITVDPDYKLGCTIETAFSRQIARPKDLSGKEGGGITADGRRNANVVEVYRTGAPNEALGGESASE